MKKRVISLVLCLLMVLSLIPTTAFASDIATQASRTKVSHIDIQMALNIPGVNNVQLDKNDMENLNISAKQGGTDVSYTWNRNSYTLNGSTDGQGHQQVRLNGEFPIGTKANPVEYTITLTKTVNGIPYTLTLTASYWTNNVCPGLTTGGDPGIDVKFGEGQSSGYQVTITKKIEGIDSKDLAANQKFKFAIKAENGTVVKELEAVTNQGVDTANATTFLSAGTYTVEETSYATYEGYEFKGTKYSTEKGTLTVNNGGSITVTNTYAPEKQEPEKTSIPVTKAWVDDENFTALRPGSIQVQLYTVANGGKTPVTGKTLTLNAANSWVGSFTDLNKTDGNGVEIEYTVEEANVPGYTSAVTGDAVNGFTITNTLNFDEEITNPGSLTIKKVNKEGIALPGAAFKLEKNGDDGFTPTTGSTNDDGIIRFDTLTVGTYTLTETQAPEDYKLGTVKTWTVKVEAGTPYAEEVRDNDGNLTGYKKVTPCTVTVEGLNAASDTYSITNEAIEKTDITVTKVWYDMDNKFGLRPDSITVQLYTTDANGENLTAVTGKTLTLTAKNSWKGTFADLPQFNKDGSAIYYTVAEVNASDRYTSTVVKDNNGNFTITNTLKTGDLVIQKVLKNAPTAANDQKFQFRIMQNGKQIGEIIEITGAGSSPRITLPIGSYTVEEIADSAKITNYEVTTTVVYSAPVEVMISALSTADPEPDVREANVVRNGITQVTVTNAYEKTITDIEVTKAWENVDGIDVSKYEIKVDLYANGQPTGKILTLTKAGNWTGKFENLDIKDKDGKVITYTVVETNVPKDFTSIDGTKENNYTVTNIHDYEIEIPFTKVIKKAPGSNNPGKATFTFVAYYMDANNAPVNVGTATVETNGEGTYSGKIKVKLSAGLPDDSIELMLAEVKGAPGSWTYADTVYNVHITGVSTDKPTVTISLANKLVEKAIFTNTYSYTYTPPRPRPNPKPVPSAKTGDMGIALYALTSLLSLSGTALVIKKRKDEE